MPPAYRQPPRHVTAGCGAEGGTTCMDSSRGGDVRSGGVRLCRVRHMAKALKPPSTAATVPVTNAAASLIR